MFRLYRKIYCVSKNTGQYTLINPISLSASTYVAGTGDTESNSIIESNISITEENTGIYYADLDSSFYASDVTYDLVWYVQYTSDAPEKKLTTRFRIKPINITHQLDFEISDVRPIEYEIIGIYN